MGYLDGNDGYIDWTRPVLHSQLGAARAGERIEEERADRAEQNAAQWRESAHILRHKIVDLNKYAHLTAINRDGWKKTARQIFKKAYPNHPQTLVDELAKKNIEQLKKDHPYDGVELSYWDGQW